MIFISKGENLIGLNMATNKIVSLDEARKEKHLSRKEEKLATMAEQFERALPTKLTPVKDFLKAKKRKKNKNKR
jgi:hypothetical protein